MGEGVVSREIFVGLNFLKAQNNLINHRKVNTQSTTAESLGDAIVVYVLYLFMHVRKSCLCFLLGALTVIIYITLQYSDDY